VTDECRWCGRRRRVLGVFLVAGQSNYAFAQLPAAFPADEGAEVVVDEIDPRGLLPDRLGHLPHRLAPKMWIGC